MNLVRLRAVALAAWIVGGLGCSSDNTESPGGAGGATSSGSGGATAASTTKSAGSSGGASGAASAGSGGTSSRASSTTGADAGAGGTRASAGSTGAGGSSRSTDDAGSASLGGGHGSGGAATTGGSAGAAGSNSGGASAAGGGTAGSGGATSDGGTSAALGPCDLYAAGNTPCVAAHSTVRALYGAYSGNLYRVKRASDNTTTDIGVLSAGGFANAAAQDTFCANTTCTISIIYDQSSKGNHLTTAPGGGAAKTADKPASATRSKLTVGGHEVYAVYFEGGMGYRNNSTSGIATGDEPESMYMVTSGKHYNSLCCFDYGNAETDNNDDGNGTMEAIYFGNQRTSWGWGNVTPNADGTIGPWVEADQENGLFAGPVFGEYKANTAVTYTYVTAMVKGKAGGFAIKAGDANSGTLKTMYEGSRPSMSGYNPMKKQGAIILGIGGDNSNGSQGTFYEGCMTSGYATSATDEAVQANIVAAGYGN